VRQPQLLGRTWRSSGPVGPIQRKLSGGKTPTTAPKVSRCLIAWTKAPVAAHGQPRRDVGLALRPNGKMAEGEVEDVLHDVVLEPAHAAVDVEAARLGVTRFAFQAAVGRHGDQRRQLTGQDHGLDPRGDFQQEGLFILGEPVQPEQQGGSGGGD